MDDQNNHRTLSSIYNEYLLSQDERQKLYEEMNEEIAKSEKEIRHSYEEKFALSEKKCADLKQELENHRKLLEKYSTFDSKLIGSIIEKLVTLFEGEDYFCQEEDYDTYEYQPTVFGRESFKVNKKVLMIVRGSQKQECYYDNQEQDNAVNRLGKNRQAIILAEDKSCINKNITFYTVQEGELKSLIDFNKFSYVKDFIDLVVKYRFENNLDKVSEKELLSMMSKFILSETQIIKDIHEKRFLEEQEREKQQLIEEQLRRNEEIEQAEFENLLQNGVPSRHNDTLIDRLRETANGNDDFNNAMSQFEISYEFGKHIARITCDEPIISSENIFISKINISSLIKDYYDDSAYDTFFHGFCDVNLVDDGLMGIVDISSLKRDLKSITNVSIQDSSSYKVDKINDQYLRVLYLPNRGQYTHKPMDMHAFYGWIFGIKSDKDGEKQTSYKTSWDCSLETEKMLTYLKEIELLSNFNEKQLKLYERRNNKIR